VNDLLDNIVEAAYKSIEIFKQSKEQFFSDLKQREMISVFDFFVNATGLQEWSVINDNGTITTVFSNKEHHFVISFYAYGDSVEEQHLYDLKIIFTDKQQVSTDLGELYVLTNLTNEPLEFINLTGETIQILSDSLEVLRKFPPSDKVASIMKTTKHLLNLEDIPLIGLNYECYIDLPDASLNKVCLVSLEIAERLCGMRKDVYTVDPKSIKTDDNGNILGYTRLMKITG